MGLLLLFKELLRARCPLRYLLAELRRQTQGVLRLLLQLLLESAHILPELSVPLFELASDFVYFLFYQKLGFILKTIYCGIKLLKLFASVVSE